MCLLQSPGCPTSDKREALPYWLAVQADLCLCWSHRSYCRFYRALTHIAFVLSLFYPLFSASFSASGGQWLWHFLSVFTYVFGYINSISKYFQQPSIYLRIIFIYCELSSNNAWNWRADWVRRSRSETYSHLPVNRHALFDDNSQQRKFISILTWYIKENRHRCNVFQRTNLQRTSTEVIVNMRRHQTRPLARTTLTTWFIVACYGKTLTSCQSPKVPGKFCGI